MPFLTALDEHAEVRGSRDPLGTMAIWSSFGRRIIGNLTTITSNVRGFTTLMLAHYFAERVRDRERENPPSLLEIFLKFEQLAGYARVAVNHDDAVRGLRRIRNKLSESRRVRISTAAPDQILSNQKVYGLWGLFSVPSRLSDLLMKSEARLTPSAMEFVQQNYLPILGTQNEKAIIDLLRRPSADFEPGNDVGTSLARIHGKSLRTREKDFYRENLAFGGPERGRLQEPLARLLAQDRSKDFGFDEFNAIQERARKTNGHEELTAELAKIAAVEHLLMPARVAFGFLLTRHDRSVNDVVREIGGTWERSPAVELSFLETLRGEIANAAGDSASADRWLGVAHALDSSDHHSLVTRLVDLNTAVVGARNSAAWLTIESGRLRVRMADEKEQLLPPDEVEKRWRSTYFINSLWSITREVS